MAQLGEFIINHWELWTALLVILLFIFINEIASKKRKAKEISPAAAVDLINHQDAVVIDIRDAKIFQNGHIINAKRIAAQDIDSERTKQYKNLPVIIVCPRGIEAIKVATRLKEQGYNQAYALSGGMAAWQAADLPTIKGK